MYHHFVPLWDGVIGIMKQHLTMPMKTCVNLCKVITEVLTLFALIRPNKIIPLFPVTLVCRIG